MILTQYRHQSQQLPSRQHRLECWDAEDSRRRLSKGNAGDSAQITEIGLSSLRLDIVQTWCWH